MFGYKIRKRFFYPKKSRVSDAFKAAFKLEYKRLKSKCKDPYQEISDSLTAIEREIHHENKMSKRKKIYEKEAKDYEDSRKESLTPSQ